MLTKCGPGAAGTARGAGDCIAGRRSATNSAASQPAPVAAIMVSTGDETWAADDRAWFASHRARSHRLRRSHRGEWPAEACHTVVRQVIPGFRVRIPIEAYDPLPPGDAPEDLAWAIFDVAEEAAAAGRSYVSADAIPARRRVLEAGGAA